MLLNAMKKAIGLEYVSVGHRPTLELESVLSHAKQGDALL